MSTTSEPERVAREQIERTEEAEARDRTERAASLFDLRRIIGGLLVVYGAMLTLMGIFGSEAVKTKAAGINIDLWAGLATLAVGAFFLAWVVLRPLRADDVGDADQDRPATE